MDGGYINEGGRMKTKNGKKYIINDHHHDSDGFYIKKWHAILIAAATLVVMLVYAILIYIIFSKMMFSPINDIAVVTTEKPTFEPHFDTPRPRQIKVNKGWSPTLYKLVMQPEIENGNSFGHVVIDITKDANEKGRPPIVLDINNITITKVEVSESNETLRIKSYYGENSETYVIELMDEPKNASLQVNIKFISQLSTTLQGFYRVGYNDIATHQQKWLVSTQFSPIDARRAFPCFDRPDKKARFEISLIHHENYTMALSNMPSKQISRPSNEYIREDFDITPLMSTYLVAFMVTNLVNATQTQTKIKDASLPQINIWSRKEVADMTEFAFELTTEILPIFEEYFGIRYNLPKIDMVAVPEFGYSAMENYGLITFKESAFLVPQDGEHRSADHIESVANIVAHELAHQWFGNLVTMKWWNDLWLKEGFATFMSYIALEEIKPAWLYLDFMSINELQKAMEVDSDLGSHPISFDVKNSDDIRRIFDPISYAKGASIIRMMQSFLGDKTFKAALRKYLKDFQYKNAVRGDLWNVMTQYGHQDKTLPDHLTVDVIMEDWTKQAGYPVLNVTRNGTTIHISQQRYLLPNGKPNNDTQKWHIPITFVAGSNATRKPVQKFWLENTESKTIEGLIGNDFYFYLNVNRTGYYRVNYDRKSWVAIKDNFTDLPEIVRAQLIDDSFNLARAEMVGYDIPLTFLLSLGSYHILPWAAATPGIKFVSNMLSREPAYEYFRAIMRYIIKPIYNEIGFEEHPSEPHVELLHRAVIVYHACFFSHDLCIHKSQVIYREWMRDRTKNLISPNLKGIVYCTALREGSFQEWYFAYDRYKETFDASEKEIILDALGCTTKPWLLSKYLNMTINPSSEIRKQDGLRAFTSVAKNSFGFETAFDFLMSNIKEISEYFGDGFLTLSRMINSLTGLMNKDYHLEQLKQFKKKAESLGLKSVEESIKLAEEKVKNNVYWRSRSYHQLQKFLSELTRHYRISLI